MARTMQDIEELEGVLYQDEKIYRTKLATFVLSDPSDQADFVRRRGLFIRASEANMTINFARQSIIKPSSLTFMVGAVDNLKIGDIIEVDLKPVIGSFECYTDKQKIAGIYGNVIILENHLRRPDGSICPPRNGGDVVKWTKEVIGYERTYVDEKTFDLWEKSKKNYG